MGLTAKQEMYCQLAAIGTDADAYRGAYDVAPGARIWADIDRLNKNPEIARRIIEIQTETFKPMADARAFLLRWHFYRMIYDPRELTTWAIGACRHCYGDGHEYQWRLHEYMRELAAAESVDGPLPNIGGGFGFNATRPPVDDCPECDGKGRGRSDFNDTRELSPAARAAFEGIKQTKDGIEIKMADKQKAADAFSKLSGLDVLQVRNIAETIPDPAELERLRSDPEAGLRVYERVIAGGNGRETVQ